MTATDTSEASHHARTLGPLTELDELAELALFLTRTAPMNARHRPYRHIHAPGPQHLLSADSFVL